MERQLLSNAVRCADRDRPAEVQGICPLGVLVYIHGVGLRVVSPAVILDNEVLGGRRVPLREAPHAADSPPVYSGGANG